MLRTDRHPSGERWNRSAEAEESGADQHGYGDDHFQCIGKTGNDKSTFFFHGYPPQISSASC